MMVIGLSCKIGLSDTFWDGSVFLGLWTFDITLEDRFLINNESSGPFYSLTSRQLPYTRLHFKILCKCCTQLTFFHLISQARLNYYIENLGSKYYQHGKYPKLRKIIQTQFSCTIWTLDPGRARRWSTLDPGTS